jgi:UDP-2,3-diacylglucosamine pyrophosphatase LpxH
MKLFISDLHMGSPLFKKKMEIVELFNSPNIEDIYILGDVIDRLEKSLNKIIVENKFLIDTINDCGKVRVVIKGNHDPDMEKMREIFHNVLVTDKLETELFGKKTILIHGDETDVSVKWSKFFFIFHYFSERLGFNLKGWVRDTAHSMSMKRQKLNYNSLVFESEKELYKKYCDNYKIIISGHTHLPKVVRLTKADYLNCGCVVRNPSYLLADLNTIILKRF